MEKLLSKSQQRNLVRRTGIRLKKLLDTSFNIPEKFKVKTYVQEDNVYKVCLEGYFSANVHIIIDFKNPDSVVIELERVYLVPRTNEGIGTSIIREINNVFKSIPFQYAICDVTDTDNNGVSVWMHIFNKFEGIEVGWI